MEVALLVDINNHLVHLSEEFLREARIVVHLRREEAWVRRRQEEVLVKMGVVIHETLLVQEVGKGRLQVLFILDRR